MLDDQESSSFDHAAMITVDALDECILRSEIDRDPDVILIACESIMPGRRAVHIASTSAQKASEFADRWNQTFYHQSFGFFGHFGD